MESDGDDLDNLFEEHESNTNEDGTEGIGNHETTNESSEAVKVPVPKRVIKNPRLKFNPERLCGERGIPVIVDHFKNVKFKGKGHEKEDLDKLLSTLEHWTHRLFPSMKFDECLHHIEKLGKKRLVQTCMRKIRLDMPILNSDFVKDDEDDVQRIDDHDPEPPEVDAFDRLIEESRDISNPSTSAEQSFETNPVHSSPILNNNRGQILGSSFGSTLSDEQKERMERNRMLAAERRKAKLAATQSDLLPINSNTASFQDLFNAHVSGTTSHSINKNQDKVSGDAEAISVMEMDGNRKDGDLLADNQAEEHLGLEDLIDLVEEEENMSDKNLTSESMEQTKLCNNLDKKDSEDEISMDDTVEINVLSSKSGENNTLDKNIMYEKTEEQTEILHNNFEDKDKISLVTANSNVSSSSENNDISAFDTADNDRLKLSKGIENEEIELLGLESMMDLVEESEECDINYSDSQITKCSVQNNKQSVKCNEALVNGDYAEALENSETENSESVLIDG